MFVPNSLLPIYIQRMRELVGVGIEGRRREEGDEDRGDLSGVIS